MEDSTESIDYKGKIVDVPGSEKVLHEQLYPSKYSYRCHVWNTAWLSVGTGDSLDVT